MAQDADIARKIGMIVALSISMTAEVVHGARCPAMESEELARYAASSGATRIIFFASWCSSCREHLKSAGKGDILVGVFDEVDRLERLAGKLNADVPCVRGDGIAKSYGVTSLPAVRPIQPTQPPQSPRH